MLNVRKDVEKCASLLLSHKLTVATAESCTGGLIASEFVSVAGCSDWFCEGCVTYSVAAKVSRLGVNPATVDTYTVVSPEVAIEMARGVRKNLGAAIGLATTGYAGPGGGDDINPVGTVYIAVSGDKIGDIAVKFHSDGTRNEVREEAAACAIDFLLTQLERI